MAGYIVGLRRTVSDTPSFLISRGAVCQSIYGSNWPDIRPSRRIAGMCTRTVLTCIGNWSRIFQWRRPEFATKQSRAPNRANDQAPANLYMRKHE
jgi:hypothetical protein